MKRGLVGGLQKAQQITRARLEVTYKSDSILWRMTRATGTKEKDERPQAGDLRQYVSDCITCHQLQSRDIDHHLHGRDVY